MYNSDSDIVSFICQLFVIKIDWANSEKPDETAHYEPSHLDFHCLQRYVRIYPLSDSTLIFMPPPFKMGGGGGI